jgi:hypothetical protein
MAGSAAAPAVSRKNVRRGSDMIVPEGYADLRSSIYLSLRHNETGKDRL